MFLIRPSDHRIRAYYDSIHIFHQHNVTHEGALETAFQRLLADTAASKDWTLVPKMRLKVSHGNIYPDGTVRDSFSLHRGYWEAKDTKDDLDVEIQKKIKNEYPLSNIIFEDTRRAVLYQNGSEQPRFDITDAQQLCDLLNSFYAYTEPDIRGFEQAIDEFKERVPELATALNNKIKAAHKENKAFAAAFADFFEICRNSLNPNISEAAVDEMLVQHLLTERVIRRVFVNAEFVHRNVIAREVERVIGALVSKSFNRDEFLKSLDRFYRAIEEAARGLEDFNEKQHFLNTVYERFFQGYSVKVADTHGIVYTPQAIVDFMCASVAEVLKTEFHTRLGATGVNILDPCTGTGNFIVNLLRRIPKRDLPRAYAEGLYANEIMLLPYYVAALNIEHAYFEQTAAYEPFEGLCFVDTLDIAQGRQTTLSFMSEANAARVQRQKITPITVIIGNPPYNQSQQDENDRNQNRSYEIIDERISQTYIAESTSTLRMQVYDPYIKFFRWATDRLQDRDGIVCLVTNNKFVHGAAFDGFRKLIARDFSVIYHFDFKGDARTTGEKRRREGGNIFRDQIRASVGITLLVRNRNRSSSAIYYHAVGDYWNAEQKTSYLSSLSDVSAVPWESLTPDGKYNWFPLENAAEFEAFIPLGTKSSKARTSSALGADAIFKLYSAGVKTNSDAYVYDFDAEKLAARTERMVEAYNAELDRWKRLGCPKDLSKFLKVDAKVLKWVRNTKRTLLRGHYLEYNAGLIRRSLYRPFTKKLLYFERAFSEDQYRFRSFFPTLESEAENRIICCTNHAQIAFVAQITNVIANEAVGGRAGQCFPLYVYDEAGSNRKDNITNGSLKAFRQHYENPRISKLDIFHYVYAMLLHREYREEYGENLRRELPRIPFASDFAAFAKTGSRLIKLHLEYEAIEPFPLEFIESPRHPLSYAVESRLRLTRDRTGVIVNQSLTLSGIPSETFEYQLGLRSALEWVIDQYRPTLDAPTGIRSDPNRADDAEFIVRLLGQVVAVSVETVRLVKALPALR